MNDEGDTRIDIYLRGITEAQAAAVLEDVCNGLARRGLANDDAGSAVRALVAADAVEFPQLGDDEQIAALIGRYGQVMIPMAFGPEHRRLRPL